MTDKNSIKNVVAQARQRQILEAAVTVFAEKGYHRATIKDIARTAGIADGTIYNYFKNKQDIMLNIVTQMAKINDLMDDIVSAAETMTLSQMLDMIFRNRLQVLRVNLPMTRAIFPQIIIDPDLQALFREKLLQPNIEKGEAIFARHIAKHNIADADPKIMIRGLLSVIFGVIMMAILGDTVILNEPELFSDQMTALFLKGLTPEN